MKLQNLGFGIPVISSARSFCTGVKVQAPWVHNPMTSRSIKIATKLISLVALLVAHRLSQ
eukprot:14696435-Ditylum_brightwellii.AAC.2